MTLSDFLKTVYAKVVAGILVALISATATTTVGFLSKISNDISEMKTHSAVTLEKLRNHDKRLETLERNFRSSSNRP